jgi:peptidoglycan hydrolase CwlO-like protein
LLSGPRRTVLCGIIAALVLSVVPAATSDAAVTVVSPSPSPSAADQLRAQRVQLEQQLAGAAGPRGDARRQLIAAEHALGDVRAKLAASRADLDRLDARLRSLTQQITSDSSGLDAAKARLGALVRVTYETGDKDGFAGAILSSGSFGEAMERVRAAQHITDEVGSLQDLISTKERSLLDARTRLQSDFQAAQALEGTLDQETGRLMAVVGQRDQIFQQLDAPSRSLATQIARIDDQLDVGPPPGPYG